MASRKSISKGRRFEIFKRDKFTCRYCGRNSNEVVLEVDHIIAIANGGTNDDDNLITSCWDCNHGKGAKTLEVVAPTEEDKLRVAQERREIMAAAELARKAAEAHDEFRQAICNFWCEANKSDSMRVQVLSVMCSFAKQHGVERVFEWIQIAADRFPGANDNRKGRYISGIRRRLIEEGQL